MQVRVECFRSGFASVLVFLFVFSFPAVVAVAIILPQSKPAKMKSPLACLLLLQGASFCDGESTESASLGRNLFETIQSYTPRSLVTDAVSWSSYPCFARCKFF
jgi:hypothetical protein